MTFIPKHEKNYVFKGIMLKLFFYITLFNSYYFM